MAFLDALPHWPVAVALRQWVIAYALLNAAHILGIGLLIGAIATLDLRLLGAFRHSSLPDLARPLTRMAAAGLGVAILTGALLFTVRPLEYAQNPAFLAKLAFVALGLLNAGLLRMGGGWRTVLEGAAVPARVRLGAALSLAIWVLAVICGRWIGFLA